MFEFNIIPRLQISGDIVVFDGANIEKYPGVVKAVSYIKLNLGYKLNIIQNTQNSRVCNCYRCNVHILIIIKTTLNKILQKMKIAFIA